MKKVTKRWLALLLIAVMALTTACGNSQNASLPDTENQQGGSQNASDDNNTSNTTGGDSSAAGTEVSSNGPIVDEPITLKVLTTRWANMGDSFVSNEFLVELEETTNVHIEWEVHSLNDWDEQKGILLSSGELPDIIFGSNTFNDADIMNNLAYFLPLDDLIDQYMPNYKQAIADVPTMAQVATFSDDHIYSFSRKLPLRPISCNQPIINMQWLENLGLDVPTTIEELHDVLLAFKEKDANGNGDPNDEIPISGAKGLSMDLLNPFGITDLNGYHMLVNGDGSLTYYPTSEAYKEGIKWLHQLYVEGIIDSEAFTQDDSMLSSKRQAPDVSRVGFEYAWTADSNFGQWSSEYSIIAPIIGPDGKAYTSGDPDGVSSILPREAMITTFCEYPEVAAQWIDRFYTGEASIQNFWGGIGTVITKHDDGTYTLNDPEEGTSADSWYWDSSLRDFGPKYASDEFEELIKLSPDSGDGKKVYDSKIAEDTVTIPYPNPMFTEEENADRPTLVTDIDKYIETTRATWITEGGIDEGWDAYIEQLNAMGLERLIEIYTDAYERYIR